MSKDGATDWSLEVIRCPATYESLRRLSAEESLLLCQRTNGSRGISDDAWDEPDYLLVNESGDHAYPVKDGIYYMNAGRSIHRREG